MGVVDAPSLPGADRFSPAARLAEAGSVAATPNRSVLIVDDEAKALDAVKKMLKGMRSDWDLAFAAGGDEAIGLLSRKSFDVVIADLRMPGVDGAALLRHTQEHHPDTVRIVMAAPTEQESAMRAIPIAHQCVVKPCVAAVLWQAIERSCSLKALLTSEALRTTISQVRSLPVLPQVYKEITAALQKPDVSMQEVARIVEQDPAITAKLLQIVNSGFFGLSRKVTKIEDAVTFLGLGMVRDLVLSAGLFRQFEQQGGHGLDLDRFQRHAMLTARIARELAPFRSRAQEAFTAGMLHDLGKVLLGGRDGAVGHAEAGGYLLGLWGLPFPIVEAVAYHHTPAKVAGTTFDVVGAVHVADLLAHEAMGPGPDGNDELPALDVEYLAAAGVDERLDEWREAAERVAVQG